MTSTDITPSLTTKPDSGEIIHIHNVKLGHIHNVKLGLGQLQSGEHE